MNNIVIRKYKESDIKAMVEIWNEVVEEGVAFPQIDGLTEESLDAVIAGQLPHYAAVTRADDKNVLGVFVHRHRHMGDQSPCRRSK